MTVVHGVESVATIYEVDKFTEAGVDYTFDDTFSNTVAGLPVDNSNTAINQWMGILCGVEFSMGNHNLLLFDAIVHHTALLPEALVATLHHVLLVLRRPIDEG